MINIKQERSMATHGTKRHSSMAEQHGKRKKEDSILCVQQPLGEVASAALPASDRKVELPVVMAKADANAASATIRKSLADIFGENKSDQIEDARLKADSMRFALVNASNMAANLIFRALNQAPRQITRRAIERNATGYVVHVCDTPIADALIPLLNFVSEKNRGNILEINDRLKQMNIPVCVSKRALEAGCTDSNISFRWTLVLTIT